MRLITWKDIWITVAEVREILGEEKARRFLEQVTEIVMFDDRGAWLPGKRKSAGHVHTALAGRSDRV